MAITYTWTGPEKAGVILSEGGEFRLGIPCDPANTDYQAFLKWCEEGNTPEPYVAPPAPAEPTPEEKLAASGLTVDELKSLLGLK